jgi:hypothetical protein
MVQRLARGPFKFKPQPANTGVMYRINDLVTETNVNQLKQTMGMGAI